MPVCSPKGQEVLEFLPSRQRTPSPKYHAERRKRLQEGKTLSQAGKEVYLSAAGGGKKAKKVGGHQQQHQDLLSSCKVESGALQRPEVDTQPSTLTTEPPGVLEAMTYIERALWPTLRSPCWLGS